MPGSNTSVRAAWETVCRPLRALRTSTASPRLVGLGVLLLVGALALALLALTLPSSASGTAASEPHASSRQATASATAHKATGSTSASSAPQQARYAAPTLPKSQRKTATPRVIELHRGDTLWSLARRYNTTVAALQALNGLGTSTLIYAGHELRLPTDSGAGTGARASTTSAPTSGTSQATDADAMVRGNAATAVAYAKAQLGKPYAWGGTGPNTFDCSGLVMRAWQAAGIDLPRTTYKQVNAGRHITRTELQPGDLIFTDSDGHVQLYIGGGQVIEAPHTGAQVRTSPLPAASQVDAYVRVAQPTATSSASSATTATATAKPSATATTTSTATPAPSTTTDSRATAAVKGIYVFSGGNSTSLATDPDVSGTSLVYYWAQLEPSPGVYRWDLVDKDLAPWAAAGKKVILRVAAGGWASWDKAADSAHGTPAWVYAQGVPSVTEQDGAVLPACWNATFLRDLSTFVHAFAARYDGNPHVALVDASVGIGGETKPDSEKNPGLLALWQRIGYTDAGWWSAVQQTIGLYTGSFHSTPVAVMPDKTFLGSTPGYNEAKTVAFAVAHGAWLQDNGLIPGRTLSAPWGQTPIVSEQRGPTSQTHDSLAADLSAALADHATVLLVFASDLTNSANRTVIHQYAQQLRATASTNTASTATASTATTRSTR